MPGFGDGGVLIQVTGHIVVRPFPLRSSSTKVPKRQAISPHPTSYHLAMRDGGAAWQGTAGCFVVSEAEGLPPMTMLANTCFCPVFLGRRRRCAALQVRADLPPGPGARHRQLLRLARHLQADLLNTRDKCLRSVWLAADFPTLFSRRKEE